jgi:tetratricopeptide (TPR) repeat protein
MPSARQKNALRKSQESKEPNIETRLPPWKKALFAIVTLVTFFGLIELILFLAGVKPITYEKDPYVGFSSQIPLYVEEGNDGQMTTARNKMQFFNRQQFSKNKAGNTTRIFCVGGSTTYGRPYEDATSFCGWLRKLLPVADPSHEWELINAGGISYASYRVAALLEELSYYEPDVVIVYCGQNEFLERRTYAGIIDMPDSVRGLDAILSRTRIYSGITRMIRGAGKKPVAEGAQLDGEVNAILDQSVGLDKYKRDKELEAQVLSHYRFNMARIVDIARASGAKVLFVTPASNLSNCSPFKSQHRDGLEGAELEKWEELMAKARANYEAKNFSGALGELDAAAKIDDQYADAHYLRGRVLEDLEQFDEAGTAYQRALDEDVCPLRALSPMPGIVAEVAQEREVPLVDFASLVLKESPNGIPGEELFLDHVHPTIDGHRKLALAIIDEMGRQDWLTTGDSWSDAAVERVASGIMKKVDPKMQGVAMRNLSKVYSWAGKMEDAYGAAKIALELFPGDAEAHYQVGNLAHRLGKTDEAIERLSYLVSVNLKKEVGFYVKAHLQLADIHTEGGDLLKSEQILKKLLQLDPGSSKGKEQWRILQLLQEAAQLVKDGLPAEAAKKLREVVRVQPSLFYAKFHLGVALVRARDFKAAAPALKAVIAAREGYLATYYNLSYVLVQLGELDEAEQVCLQALKIDPNYEDAKKGLRLIRKQKAARN